MQGNRRYDNPTIIANINLLRSKRGLGPIMETDATPTISDDDATKLLSNGGFLNTYDPITKTYSYGDKTGLSASEYRDEFSKRNMPTQTVPQDPVPAKVEVPAPTTIETRVEPRIQQPTMAPPPPQQIASAVVPVPEPQPMTIADQITQSGNIVSSEDFKYSGNKKGTNFKTEGGFDISKKGNQYTVKDQAGNLLYGLQDGKRVNLIGIEPGRVGKQAGRKDSLNNIKLGLQGYTLNNLGGSSVVAGTQDFLNEDRKPRTSVTYADGSSLTITDKGNEFKGVVGRDELLQYQKELDTKQKRKDETKAAFEAGQEAAEQSAADLGITTDEFFSLPFPERLRLGIADISDLIRTGDPLGTANIPVGRANIPGDFAQTAGSLPGSIQTRPVTAALTPFERAQQRGLIQGKSEAEIAAEGPQFPSDLYSGTQPTPALFDEKRFQEQIQLDTFNPSTLPDNRPTATLPRNIVPQGQGIGSLPPISLSLNPLLSNIAAGFPGLAGSVLDFLGLGTPTDFATEAGSVPGPLTPDSFVPGNLPTTIPGPLPQVSPGQPAPGPLPQVSPGQPAPGPVVPVPFEPLPGRLPTTIPGPLTPAPLQPLPGPVVPAPIIPAPAPVIPEPVTPGPVIPSPAPAPVVPAPVPAPVIPSPAPAPVVPGPVRVPIPFPGITTVVPPVISPEIPSPPLVPDSISSLPVPPVTPPTVPPIVPPFVPPTTPVPPVFPPISPVPPVDVPVSSGDPVDMQPFPGEAQVPLAPSPVVPDPLPSPEEPKTEKPETDKSKTPDIFIPEFGMVRPVTAPYLTPADVSSLLGYTPFVPGRGIETLVPRT